MFPQNKDILKYGDATLLRYFFRCAKMEDISLVATVTFMVLNIVAISVANVVMPLEILYIYIYIYIYIYRPLHPW